jgi:hypothetical protein
VSLLLPAAPPAAAAAAAAEAADPAGVPLFLLDGRCMPGMEGGPIHCRWAARHSINQSTNDTSVAMKIH